MKLYTAFQASFISETGLLAGKSAVLNLLNLMKGKNNPGSIPRHLSETSIGPALAFAENSRAVPSFPHVVQGQPAAVVSYALATLAKCITRQKRHRLTTAKVGGVSVGGANVFH
jgi:hypothetical protein